MGARVLGRVGPEGQGGAARAAPAPGALRGLRERRFCGPCDTCRHGCSWEGSEEMTGVDGCNCLAAGCFVRPDGGLCADDNSPEACARRLRAMGKVCE